MPASKRSHVILAALLALPFFCSALSAQVRIDKIDWQISRVKDNKKLPFETVSELKLGSYQRYADKLRAVVTAQNLSARPVEGLVLRCALSLRLVKLPAKLNVGAADPGAPDPGFWTVPFRVEEVRISRIKPGGLYEAKLIHSALNEQLKKLKNSGFRADALKLQVMLDPRPGDEPSRIMKEAVIEIKKP
ncbi:MAG: hypothetical protein A2X28_04905 [Elusimicrobia bacterium GWA2_56_46]|nr:MAG: hypothetical protein A2X28_04905 [Elusimicrobia bacterium GWA2_56_46]OGR56211.1 MAG: hypothetical protein A2X39_08325 [Elusimicrobia bacterium GWC2_56_31]HBB66960.1 hypothetical protein [Elusimicrobiota bacterium]HBW23012.1 hypothetical protein [Elusimicrobiota bacterium]